MSEQEKTLKFEEALQKLEKIVSEMESGQLPLDETMAKFEEGMKLSKFCTGKLEGIEKKVEILMQKATGESEWAPFNGN